MRLWPFVTQRQIDRAIEEEMEDRNVGPPFQDDPIGGPSLATTIARSLLDKLGRSV